MVQQLERLELLIGKEGIETLKQKTILIVGVGGVGGYVAESLARCGIGKLILMDHDVVSLTNLNRQIIATYDSIGQYKTELMKQRIQQFSGTQVECINAFFNEDTALMDCDYVVDCIDTITSKMDIIKKCHDVKIPCISSLGMANRFDPSLLRYTTLDKTSYDPLAKAMRKMAKERNYRFKIEVVVSLEQAYKQNKLVNPDGKTYKEKYPPGSNSFVPASAGLLLGSIVVRNLLKKGN